MFSYSEWYQKNKKRISAKRKARYQRDTVRRARLRQRATSYYHTYVKKEKVPDRHIIESGEGERFYTIGRLAFLIRRKVETIRMYHRRGIIPSPTHADHRGWRLYTPAQATLLQLVFRKLDSKEIRNLKEAKKEIVREWKKG